MDGIGGRPNLRSQFVDLKFWTSSGLSCNMKSSGNRSRLRRTDWLKTFVGTPVQQRQVAVEYHLLSANHADVAFIRGLRHGVLRIKRFAGN